MSILENIADGPPALADYEQAKIGGRVAIVTPSRRHGPMVDRAGSGWRNGRQTLAPTVLLGLGTIQSFRRTDDANGRRNR